jgi:hypothetical protein
LDSGTVHDKLTCPLPAVATTLDGASETVRGVALADAEEYVPVPAAFTAATRKTYDVPFVKPVTVADVDVETESLNVVQVEPEFEEC